MGPVDGGVEDVEWIGIEEPTAAGMVRRRTSAIAARLGFPTHRVAEIGIAANELATNAHVHGVGSSILIRVHHSGVDSTVELVVIDEGPGRDDIGASFEDGISTSGTLGIGLGAVRRISNSVDVYSRRGKGTVLAAVFARHTGTTIEAPVVDGLTRPIRGEVVCGDMWASALDGNRVSVVVTDGLGHGPLAAEASQAVVDAFNSDPWRSPADTIRAAHQRAGGTRGAAVSAAMVDRAERRLRFAGVGNVAARIVGMSAPAGCVPQPGIVGHHIRTVREVDVPLEAGCLLVIHSDGLTSRWDLDSFVGIGRHGPAVVAGVLMREAARPDDVTVVVVRVDP